MFNSSILICSASLFILPWLGAQVRFVDLTSASPNLAEWKIVSSEASGSVGPSPSHVPVSVRLLDCTVNNSDLYFSVEIYNDRKLDVQVPVSVNAKLVDHQGTITFRQLLIRLGTATDTQDASTFKADPHLGSIDLFGDQSVPGTVEVLAPGERLLLRLKVELRSKAQERRDLRVHIGALDTILSPTDAGFREAESWVPALSVNSEPAACGSKQEAK